MNPQRLLPAALSVVLVSSATATTINYSNFAADFSSFTPIVNAAGTTIPATTGIATLGYFLTSDNATIAAGTSSSAAFAALAADFVQFGTGTTFGANLGVDGIFQEVPSVATPAGNPFVGQTIYSVIGNGTTFATSGQVLVYDTGLTFEADNPAANQMFNFNTVDTSDAALANALLIGSFGASGEITGVGTFPAFSLEVIPEPGTLAVCFGALAFGLVRRRRVS